MGGLFGGGKKKSSSSDPKSTTADSIETADGTVYDRRGTTTATDNMPKTNPVSTMAAPAQAMGAQSAPQAMAQPKMDAMETIVPAGTRRKRNQGTLAGQAYG